jgi:myo-inositol-1(or 4)-monophosphatase
VSGIAAEAGAMAHDRFDTDFRRWEKTPGSPVCEVDLDVDRMLKARLSALLPDAGWLSEETADNADRLAHDLLWVVDPIDGTRDYIRARPGWCVSVALVDRGRSVIGILDAPSRGEHWLAVIGQGATRNGVTLHAGNRTDFPGSRTPVDALPKADRDLVMVHKPNSIALRIAMVAADEADLVATLRWGNEWDIAAAVLVASEAGATVSDALGVPLVFNKPRPQAFGVLTSTPGIHLAAVERLADRARNLLA